MSRIGTFADDDLTGWILHLPDLGRVARVQSRGSLHQALAVDTHANWHER